MLSYSVRHSGFHQLRRWVSGVTVALLAACGGGGGSPASVTPEPLPPVVDARLVLGDAIGHQTLLNAVPAEGGGGGGGGTATTLTIHYKRIAGDYTGWTLHTFDAAVETTWASGLALSNSDSFGAVVQVPLKGNSGSVGYIFHKGDEKDHNNADQRSLLSG